MSQTSGATRGGARIAIFAAVIACLTLWLAACTASRDTRTAAERERDAAIWTRAHDLQVASAQSSVRGCALLGRITEHYYEDVPPDAARKPKHMPWPEYILRFKAAELGANAAVLQNPVDKWRDRLDQVRVLGEAYRCSEPEITAAR